jgi:sarcosine dehydrogenase
VFGSKLGWERPNWFAPEGVEPKDIYSMGRQNWFDAVGEEHAHVRGGGLFDQSSFAKYELSGQGRRRGAGLRSAPTRGDRPWALTYTQLLNSRGGIEADLTVARLAEDRFYIVTGTGFRTHDFGWIADTSAAGRRARCRCDRRLGHAVADGAEGARHSGKGHAPTCRTPPSPSARPARSPSRAPVRALRVTYVGELGWELHVPDRRLGDGLRRADGRGPLWAAPGRLPRAGIAAAGKGLSRLVLRHHAQRHAVRGGPGLGGEAEVGSPFLGRGRLEALQASR